MYLREIIQDNDTVGFAAISTIADRNYRYLHRRTIGGFPTSIHETGPTGIIGYIDYQPQSTKRDALQMVARPETLNNWAKEQLEILENMELTDHERAQLNFNEKPAYSLQEHFQTF